MANLGPRYVSIRPDTRFPPSRPRGLLHTWVLELRWKKVLEVICWLSNCRLATQGQKVGHDRSGGVRSSVHLDVKLSGIDEAALKA